MIATGESRRPRYRKVFVLAPSHLTTGGPEALHQLVDAIRALGGDAYISYWPFDGGAAPVPEPYRGYNVVAAPPQDEPGNLIVIPEIRPLIARQFAHATTAIWWLSFDHFLGETERPGWDELRGRVNFSQSRYAADRLAAHGIATAPLTDYLNAEFRETPPISPRRNAIAYGARSIGTVLWLRRRTPLRLCEWVLLDRMNRADVRNALSEVKLYVDFGNHPGRDRMPREAALCGACVITGRRGSAANAVDVPLPDDCKLDDDAALFGWRLAAKALSVFGFFDRHVQRMESYRHFARDARTVFFEEVGRAFFE